MFVVYCKNRIKGINIYIFIYLLQLGCYPVAVYIACARARVIRMQWLRVLPPLIRTVQWNISGVIDSNWVAGLTVSCRRMRFAGVLNEGECGWSICTSSRLSLWSVDTRTMPGCNGRKSTYCPCKESKPLHMAFWLQQGKVRHSITLLAKHPHSDRFLFQNRKQLLLIQRGSCVWKSSGQDGASELACDICITCVSVRPFVVRDTDRK